MDNQYIETRPSMLSRKTISKRLKSHQQFILINIQCSLVSFTILCQSRMGSHGSFEYRAVGHVTEKLTYTYVIHSL